MNTIKLIVSSPDGTLFSDEIVSLSVRGADGDLAIMSGHMPFVTSVKPCEFHVVMPDGEIRYGHTDGGLLTVSDNEAVFLTGNIIWLEAA